MLFVAVLKERRRVVSPFLSCCDELGSGSARFEEARIPTVCTICALSEAALHEVNQALVRGEASRVLARRLGLSRYALMRHARKHLSRSLAPAYTEREISQAHDLRLQLEQFRDEAIRLKEKAEKKGDLRTALGAIRELCRIVELVAKLSGQLSERATTNVLNVNLDADTARRIAETYLLRHRTTPSHD